MGRREPLGRAGGRRGSNAGRGVWGSAARRPPRPRSRPQAETPSPRPAGGAAEAVPWGRAESLRDCATSRAGAAPEAAVHGGVSEWTQAGRLLWPRRCWVCVPVIRERARRRPSVIPGALCRAPRWRKHRPVLSRRLRAGPCAARGAPGSLAEQPGAEPEPLAWDGCPRGHAGPWGRQSQERRTASLKAVHVPVALVVNVLVSHLLRPGQSHYLLT